MLYAHSQMFIHILLIFTNSSAAITTFYRVLMVHNFKLSVAHKLPSLNEFERFKM